MKSRGSLLTTIFLLSCLIIAGCIIFKDKGIKISSLNNQGVENQGPDENATYGVSTSNVFATEVGIQILESGGNAVDAAIAISYVLGVVQPDGSGIGGGGGMLIYDPSMDNYDFFNYRDSAPISSSVKLNAIGVPGLVKGMETVHSAYGTLPLADLIQPAIDYAENGFKLYADLAKSISASEDYFLSNNLFTTKGRILKEGELVKQPELAATLRLIQKQGSEVFYEGEIAQQIVNSSTLTFEDLASYEVKRDEPVVGTYEGYTVVSAPAPFSGVTLIQMLKMFEEINIANPATDANKYLDQLNLVTQIAAADRIKNLSDPDFYSVDEQQLVSDSYINHLLSIGSFDFEDDEEHESTTHFVVLDKDGMMVSCTNTLGNFWGSKQNVSGIFLNAALNNFSESNTGINCYEPGKQPRNFTSPTIISKDDMMFGIGTPGGSRILKIMAPILLENLHFGVDLQTAINKARVIFKDPTSLYVEVNDMDSIVDYQNSSYSLIKQSNPTYFGAVQVIGKSNEGIYGATDYRRHGSYLIK